MISRWLVTFVVIVMMNPSPMAAQDRSDVVRARSLFEEAMRSMDRGDFDRAITEFQASLGIAPRAPTAFNLAMALRGAGRLREAMETFEGLLGERFGRMAPPQEREVAQLLRETETELATLRVRIAGAPTIELRIDGERIEDVSTNVWIECRIDPGAHVVTASAPDRQTAERDIEVARGEHIEVDFVLEPIADIRPGVLILETTEPSHLLSVVGIAENRGSLRAELASGEYVVRVEGNGGFRESSIEVPPGRTVRLRIDPPPPRSVVEEPWLWIGIGAAVMIGAGVGIGVGVTSPATAEPQSGPPFGQIVTLSVP